MRFGLDFRGLLTEQSRAPARVHEDGPIPRNLGMPLQSLAGNGRILIAASNIDQSADELPTKRHSIFTCAFLASRQCIVYVGPPVHAQHEYFDLPPVRR